MPNIEDYEAMTKISLSEDEKTIVSGYMNMLLDSFKKLEDTDVSGVVPLISVLDVKSPMRDDVAIKTISREELLSNAPEQHDAYFQVPRTVD
ncbi:MAG TPA: Asp-tRNA(Asn)/Glu-tRNA(Gln) amidotransferase subunit GatC [Clostridiales bacterium]|jgi:aspartyl-tRNA(Asn)/glutamyl-tRNA(Gln) amidotransferase subunit C|nr:Asp-tRNA(Asn)/Glu-tRNA(Gln) amidotransferase subunit GatC [Clostridiales bacterium]